MINMLPNPNCVSCAVYPVLCEKVDKGTARLEVLEDRQRERQKRVTEQSQAVNAEDVSVRLDIIFRLSRLGIIPNEQIIAEEEADADRGRVFEASRRLENASLDLAIGGIEFATQKQEISELVQILSECPGVDQPRGTFQTIMRTVMGPPCFIYPHKKG